jgi:CubicO group peptidase (beta-lactamase class C family)
MRTWLAAFMLLAASAARAAPVDDSVRAEMAKRHIPGLAVAVLKTGKTVAITGYGLANIETGTQVTGQTVFKIASLSKAFIADAVLLLAQDGKLALDDRAAKYLTDAPLAWQDITVRQLLNHTSGLVRDPADYHPYDAQPLMDVIRNAYALPLATIPGEKMLYSNIGYYILAEIVSRTGGKPWDHYIAEQFFAPAGMINTRTTTSDIVPNRAGGYHWTDKSWINAEDWIAVRPSGAFLSTAQDMARWEVFQRSPQFPLSASSRTQAIALAHLSSGAASPYGFGWYVESFLGQSRIHHDGQYPGFRSDYEKFGSGLTVIALANDDNGGLENLTLKIAGFYDSALVAPSFGISAQVPAAAETGAPVAITISATAKDRAAPGSLVEMEIWDATGKAVFKQHKTDEDFGSGETRRLDFSWTPRTAGTYTVNVGAYGPKWVISYAWSQKAATITVN